MGSQRPACISLDRALPAAPEFPHVRRGIRFYGKKRGHRRTGTSPWGSLALGAFFGLCLLWGCGMLALLIRTHIIPEWRANRQFIPHECQVLKKRIAQKTRDGADLYRPEVLIRYQVDGRDYELWTWSIGHLHNANFTAGRDDKAEALKRFEVGGTVPCWYDPADPSVAVVSRAYAWAAWASLLLPASFIIIGGTGLGYTVVNWGKSAERRAALAQQAEHVVQLDLFDEEALEEAQEYPQVPRDSNLTNSPGVKLAYRLPVTSSTGWALFGLIAGSLAWNGMVVLFIVWAVRGFAQGRPDWVLTLLLLPFAAVGGALVRLCARKLLVFTGIGPTCLEISDHPLYPGRGYRINVSQSGRLDLQLLEVALVCDERATYQQGTNIRTDARRVYERSLWRKEKFAIEPGASYEALADLVVPPDAMHSFRAKHNEVQWRLVVRGRATGWPAYERDFPIIVYPPPNGAPQI
jgi:hypothetical protein